MWYDIPYSANLDGDAVDDVQTHEFFNTITTSELRKHKVKLEVGVSLIATLLEKILFIASLKPLLWSQMIS